MAAEEAIADAGVRDSGIDQNRLATIVGTGLGGCETLDAGYERLYGRGLTRLPPTLIPASMYNAATSAVAAHVGARGPAFSIVSACASSAHAIGQGMDWIRTGRADMVICGGSDAPLTIGIIRAWESMRVLAIDNEHPEKPAALSMRIEKGSSCRKDPQFSSWNPKTRHGREARGSSLVAGFGLSSDAGTSPIPLRRQRARDHRGHERGRTDEARHRLHQRAWDRNAGQDVAETTR